MTEVPDGGSATLSESEGPPSTLYHYTDAAGLLGIVKGSSWDIGDWPEMKAMLGQAGHLLASDVRYMNDSQELKYGARFFVTALQNAARDKSLSDDARQACAKLAAIFSTDDVFDWQLRCFAACFCEHGDLLSQWRGYAGGAGGYAIGFSRDALSERSFALAHNQTTLVDTPEKADLEPVQYGDINAAAAADKLIDRIRNPDGPMRLLIHGADAPARKAITQAIGLQALATYVLRVIVSVKDDGFAEEHEWRLYYVGQQQPPVKIRVGRPGIVPYLHMAVNMKKVGEDTIPPTINKLVVGPGHNQRSQIAAARELLKACGHSPDVVAPSRLSFTG
jgi:hypothetical protein